MPLADRERPVAAGVQLLGQCGHATRDLEREPWEAGIRVGDKSEAGAMRIETREQRRATVSTRGSCDSW